MGKVVTPRWRGAELSWSGKLRFLIGQLKKPLGESERLPSKTPVIFPIDDDSRSPYTGIEPSL